MMQKSFSELLSLAHNSDCAILELLRRFQPLLNKYARKFHDSEEYYSQFQLYLIHLIKNFPASAINWNDGQIVAYVAKSMYTQYIKLSKQSLIYENTTIEFNPEIMAQPFEQNYNLDLSELFQVLSPSQREVLYRHYVQGFSIQEIATMQNRSRQAVNKTKNQALKILTKQFDIQKEK